MLVITFHDAVTAVLVYLAIGALTWFWLYCVGIVGETTATMRSQGRSPSGLALVMASAFLILVWPAVLKAALSRVPR